MRTDSSVCILTGPLLWLCTVKSGQKSKSAMARSNDSASGRAPSSSSSSSLWKEQRHNSEQIKQHHFSLLWRIMERKLLISLTAGVCFILLFFYQPSTPLIGAHSPQPVLHLALWTRRILSSLDPQRCREGCESGFESSWAPPASRALWGSLTLHPAPASPQPEEAGNGIFSNTHANLDLAKKVVNVQCRW